MVLLDEWQVQLSVPAELPDEEAARVRQLVDRQLRAWATMLSAALARSGDAVQLRVDPAPTDP
jgi:hypothetical protein